MKRAQSLLVLLAAMLLFLGGATRSSAQTFSENVLYNFCSQGGSGCTDGYLSTSGLVQGSDGNYYGTSYSGGANGYGTVFKITSSGALTTLYSFCSQATCADGSNPAGGLVQGSHGNFYGTTLMGGAYNYGSVFEVTPAGAVTTLYSFCGLTNCADGAYPEAGLVQGSDGNFYGTTQGGGTVGTDACAENNGCGTVFQMTPSGFLTTLYTFCTQTNCPDGADPYGGLLQGSDGNYYGTTSGDGPSDGTVFKITSSGSLTTLYSFCSVASCADGEEPFGGLFQGSDGNFYGTTSGGGTGGTGDGTVFKITPSGTLTTLYNFCTLVNCTDGSGPYAGLIEGSDGNYYGTTYLGGSVEFNSGSAFQISPGGTLTTLYNFCGFSGCSDGSYPEAVPLQGSDGNFYSTTSGGGTGDTSGGGGTIFNITASPALAAPVQLSLSTYMAYAGVPVTLSWQVLNAVSTTLQQCYAYVQNSATGAGTWTGLQTGTLKGNTYSGSTTITTTAVGTYTYALTCGGQISGFATLAAITPLAASLTSLSPKQRICR